MGQPAFIPKQIPHDDILRWENELLTWFAESGTPLFENRFGLGGFEYFQFSSSFKTESGRSCGSFGRSQNRRTALLKCVAEYVERKAMMEFFQSSPKTTIGIPCSFHTSNGWAVHFTPEKAQRNAYLEALERHLLLKSFLKYGWSGFKLVEKIKTKEVELFFLTSVFVAGGLVAGLVAAKSEKYAGVSFGYCVGSIQKITETSFWESALFESIDRILFLNGKEIKHDPVSWIRSETKHYLESPFDLELLESGRNVDMIFEDAPLANLNCIDLSVSMSLKFPLYAAFAWGSDLIPLFHKSTMKIEDFAYLEKILKVHGLVETVPERHPVL